MKAVHDLKSWPEYFRATLNGRKMFEVRKNDRSYRPGDVLNLKEYDIDTGQYSGRTLMRRVTYVLRVSPGLAEGYVIMGLADGPGE